METGRDPDESEKDPKPEGSEPLGPSEPTGAQPRIPKPETEQDEKRYLVKDDDSGPNLFVTVSGGFVEKTYAPAELLGRLVERVAIAINAMSGSPPMLYEARAGDSMTLSFGDPVPSGEQSQLALKQTLDAANQIAELIELEDDDLFHRAVELGGRRVRPYNELAKLVASDGLNLDWAPADRKSVRLSAERAENQRKRLAEPPEMRQWSLTIHGLLYGVITDAPAKEGRIRIRPHEWSSLPPGASAKGMLSIHYEGPILSAKIRDGLIGEPVEAIIHVRQPRPGGAIDQEHMELLLADIYKGPSEASAYGTPVDDVIRDIDDGQADRDT